ncbi:hypothetical protein CPB83DRAFT_778911, partial [Crepidotus variabilis]
MLRPHIHLTQLDTTHLHPLSSSLRPSVPADRRIFEWKGVNVPSPRILNHPFLQSTLASALSASLRDTSGYGSGLRKFHIFCDIFSIPEKDRLPAPYPVIHSFALWAASDPLSEPASDPLSEPAFDTFGVPSESVSVPVVRKYLSAIRAWHITQGWEQPLSDSELSSINWSLRGLDNIQAQHRKRPVRPPITTRMLHFLRSKLNISQPFDACIWAMASCAFFGMMRFGEISSRSRSSFDKSKHLTRKDALLGFDMNGSRYVRLDLPCAKTARPGEIQFIYLTNQGSLCPIDALNNLASVVPARAGDPLFSWRDHHGDIRPMVHSTALRYINNILQEGDFGTSFGHSFRIGG